MEPPQKPDESDCCNSLCNPCILDVYEQQLKKYNEKCAEYFFNSCDNCLSQTTYSVFKVIKIKKHTDDSFMYCFKYIRPHKAEKNNLKNELSIKYKPGQHFLIKGNFACQEFTRAYTPIPVESEGNLQFTVLVKLYKHGLMSKFFSKFKIGEETLWRGPYGDFNVKNSNKHLLLISQGSGIAPIYSVLCDMLKNEDCFTFIKLFHCCKGQNLYLREQLHELSSYWNFTYELFINDPQKLNVKYNEVIHCKKLTFGDVKSYLIDKKDKVQILICGGEKFEDEIKSYVLECEVRDNDVYLF